MTREETTAWNKVNDYAPARHGYSVVSMDPHVNVGYTIKLNQLGASAQPRHITIFLNLFRSIITSDELPETVKRNMDTVVQ